MSNPFRRSVAPKLPGVESSSSTPSSYPNDTQSRGDDALTTPAQPQTKKKRVKIQSPPDSPELQASPDDRGRRLSASDSAGRADSPPPPAPTAVGNETGGEESDSTATADSDLEEALKNTRRNSGSLPPVGNASQASTMRAPYNPFARTLANRERNATNKEAAQDKSGEQRGAGRPALDVDQFKNILLTGSAAPSPPSAAGATTAGAGISQPRPDSNSASTDNSSLFDPAYGVHAESPRTSFDDYEDASDNGEEDDTEHSNLMGSDGRLDDLAPPAPPKPQKPRGPQTVSFADFDQTIPPDFISSQRAKSPANPQLTGILRPPMTRSSSDLNKPLPPPPRSPAEPPAPSVPEKDSPAPQQPLPSPTPTDDKKAPPPPPTRRKAPDSGRPRSSSNLSNTTQDSVNSMATSGSAAQIPPTPPRTDDTSSKLAPPPPPARKSHSNSQSSTPAVETPPQEPSPSNSTNEVPKAAPAPPPRRHPSKAIRQTPSHSPAGANRQSMKPGDAFLSSLTGANSTASTSASASANSNNNANAPAHAPPAPPPRRAAGSKRTSFDGRPDTLARRLSTEHHRRSSNNSFDSDRSGSISSLQRGESAEQAVVSPPAEQRDILADMTAFQAEIDALRAQNEKER